MEDFDLFDCQFVAVQRYLGSDSCLRGKEVLEKLLDEDFRHSSSLLLVHPKKHFAYYHEYVACEEKNTYILRVCNQRIIKKSMQHFVNKLELDHPFLYVVVDLKGAQPIIRIEKSKYVKESTEEVASVLAFSLDFVMTGYGWKPKLTPSTNSEDSLSDTLQKTLEDCLKSPHTMEELDGEDAMNKMMPGRKKAKRSKADFRSAVIDEAYADEIIALLHRFIKGKQQPIDIMRPFIAAKAAGVLGKFTQSAFIGEFGDILGKSISSVNKYQRKDCKAYVGDDRFKTLKEVFAKIVKL